MRGAWWCGVLLFGATAAFGQGMMGSGMGAQQQSLGANQSVMAAMFAPVTGEPYKADKVSRSVQKLGDGTVITHETKGLIARDTQGRIREDLYMVHSGQMAGRERDSALQSATVGDPVTHTMLIWTDEKSKMALQMQLPGMPHGLDSGAAAAMLAAPPPPPRPPLAPGTTASVSLGRPSAASKDEVRTEELGQQSIEGILVTGKRTTTTIPTGRIGNDRPMVVVHEEWRSPELKILVKTIDTDPRTGEQTMELEGLVRTEPDEALFHAPAGFQVKDMAEMMKGLGDLGKTKTP